jgi:hypothetical protein
MLRLGVSLVLVVGALAALAPAAAPKPQATTLQASVGANDAYVISLSDASGARVTHLDPGSYTIHVADLSDLHDFHLTGPGVDKAFGFDGTGTVDWDVTLVDGTYKFFCDFHQTQMHGSFTVGTVTTPPPPQRLVGSVGPGAKISLPRTAKAGKTIVTIRDRTKKDNFHLSGPAVNKKTGLGFTGTVSWTVTLKAGTYTFRSDANRALKRTLKVT